MLSLMISTLMSELGIRRRSISRQGRGIALDLEIEEGDLVAGAIEDDDVRLADGDAGDVDAAGGADDRVGDLRVGHQDVAGVARQVDDDRLVEADLDGAMEGAGCRGIVATRAAPAAESETSAAATATSASAASATRRRIACTIFAVPWL